MQEYQLFLGMTIAAMATLYAVIHRLYTPRTQSRWRYKSLFTSKKSKGKKGKKQAKAAAPRKTKAAVKAANPLPPQTRATQTPPPGAFPPSESVTPTKEDVVLASPTQLPATPMPLSSHPPFPAPRNDPLNEPVKLIVRGKSSSASALAEVYSRIVNKSSVTTLAETKLLFDFLEKDRSDKAVSSPTLLSPNPNLTTNTFSSSQAPLRAGLDALRKCLQADLRIDPARTRTPALLAIIWDIHFAMAPEFPLPLQNTGAQRFSNSREVATVFLHRYGSVLWPDESQPAPHLIDRTLQFARDGSVDPSRYWEWHNLGHPHPKKGSLTDLQISKLGIRMTKFVGLVYDLPIKRCVGVDWDVIALVLDDVLVREETLGARFEHLPDDLKRQVLKVD
jgi:hypothetical protein